MGTAAISDGDYVHVAINHADLIIMVGHDVVEKPPFFMHPKDTRKVRPLIRRCTRPTACCVIPSISLCTADSLEIMFSQSLRPH